MTRSRWRHVRRYYCISSACLKRCFMFISLLWREFRSINPLLLHRIRSCPNNSGVDNHYVSYLVGRLIS